MAKSNTDHIVVRNSNLFCTNCGREQIVPFPIAIPIFVAMNQAFTKIHKACPKTWNPVYEMPDKTIDERVIHWLSAGERGTSSETIYSVISGNPVSRRDIPHDPDDFKRCYLLLELIPEWRSKLDLMKPLGAAWSNLVDNWDKLTEMLEEQMSTGKRNGMYIYANPYL